MYDLSPPVFRVEQILRIGLILSITVEQITVKRRR